jgi:capsular exopolysaccharide synthesis family protein
MALRNASNTEGRDDKPQLVTYVSLIRNRWPVILVCVLLGLAIAFLDIMRTPKAYVATSQVFVTTSQVKDASGLFSGNQFAQSRVQSYVAVVTSPLIVEPVRTRLGIRISERQLAHKISATAPLNKTLVNISVRDGSAREAAAIANAAATRFITVVKDIETQTSATATQAAAPVLRLTVIHPAAVPSAPVAPQKRLLLLAGFFGGLVGGLLIVVLREWLNNRLRSPIDVEAISSLPLLGVIPNDRGAKAEANAFSSDNASPRSEAFRLLRTNLQFIDVDRPPKVIAITSPLGGEGRTSIALNLAVSLSEIGLNVGLIEMDLRQPVLGRLLGLDGYIGLTSLLTGSARIEDAVQFVHSGLAVVTSGALPPNPSELLGSKQMRAVITSLSDQFDYLILDAAPLLSVADGAEVVSVADASLLVVRAGDTSRDSFRRAVGAIGQVGAVIAGVVVNRSRDARRAPRNRRGGNPRPRANPETRTRQAPRRNSGYAVEGQSYSGSFDSIGLDVGRTPPGVR